MAGELVLPGQLDLIAKIDIDRHERKKTGLPVSYYAIRRAKGILELLPQQMYPSNVSEGTDGSVEFTWGRHDEHAEVVLRMCALPQGGLRYYYSVKQGKNEDRAGGMLKAHQSDLEALSIVRRVVVMLTPAHLRGSSAQLRT